MYGMDGFDWFWMSLMMVFWVVVLGAVVYVAVRLGQRPPTGKPSLAGASLDGSQRLVGASPRARPHLESEGNRLELAHARAISRRRCWRETRRPAPPPTSRTTPRVKPAPMPASPQRNP